MSISVGNVNYNTPSFKGIVKVAEVYIDGKRIPVGEDNFADKDTKKKNEDLVDKATRDIKAILMKKDNDSKILQAILKKNYWDRQTTLMELEENLKNRLTNKSVFRQIYRDFDKDYNIPKTPHEGDAREIFAKIRTNNGDVFLVSGYDAAYVAKLGKNIGSKRKLEKTFPKEAIGAEESARSDYFDGIDSIKYDYDKETEPKIYLYLKTIKVGKKSEKEKIILSSARMENAQNNRLINPNARTQTIYFDRKMTFWKKPQNTSTEQTNNTTQKLPDKIHKTDIQEQTEKITQREMKRNTIIDESLNKNPDAVLVKPKRGKRIPKKYKDLPGQMTFDF